MKFFRAPCYFLLTIIIIFGLLVSTNTGLKLFINISSFFIDGKLDIKNIKGNLLSNVTLEHVTYHNSDVELQIENCDFIFLFGNLINKKLYLSNLNIENAFIKNFELEQNIRIKNVEIKNAKGFLVLDENVDFTVQSIKGNIDKTKLSGGFRIQKESNYKINLNLTLGKDKIKVVNNGANHEWDIYIKDIKKLNNDYSGRLYSYGKGTWENDKKYLIANLNLKDLKVNDLLVQEIQSSIKFDSEKENKFLVNSIGKNIENNYFNLENVKLNGTGDLRDHNIQLEIKNKKDYLNSLIKGSISNDKWSGEIRDIVTFFSKQKWVLQNKVNFEISKDNLKIDTFKIKNSELKDTSVEGNFSLQNENNLFSEWEIKNLPTSQLKSLFPDNVNVNGSASLNLKINKPKGKDAIINGSIDVNENEVKIAEKTFKLNPSKILFNYENEKLNYDLNLNFDDNTIQGKSVINNLSLNKLSLDEIKKLPINGLLYLNLNDLQLINSWVPEAYRVQGKLRIIASMNGTILNPNLNLKGKLKDGSCAVTIASIGTYYNNINLDFEQYEDGKIKINGIGNVDEKELFVKGEIDYKDFTKSKILLSGEELKILNSRKSELIISPDITISMPKKDIMLIEGNINVIKGNLDLRSIFPMVYSSNDTVFVNKEDSYTLKVATDLKVKINDKVYVKDTSLRGFVKGNINLVTSKDCKRVLAKGRIDIVSGYYKLMGKDFVIKQGYLLYPTNAILSNPFLNITLSRDVDDNQVNLYVYNTLSSPKIESYKGSYDKDDNQLKSLDIAKETNADAGSIVGHALLPDAIKDNNPFVDEIGMKDSQEEDGKQTIILGKKISPNLSLQYLYGWDKDKNKVKKNNTQTGKLKAKLNDYFSIDAEVENSDEKEKIGLGLDLSFKYEID